MIKLRIFLRRTFLYLHRGYRKQIFSIKAKKVNSKDLWHRILRDVTLIDIGASYFLPAAWSIPLSSKLTHLISIEPNSENLDYLDTASIGAVVTKIPFAVSATGGIKTLYKTNVDSGSSLYPPRVPSPFEVQLNPALPQYLFPLKTTEISTVKLSDVIKMQTVTSPILLKLDIQGAELEVLRSVDKVLRSGQVIGIEIESSLKSDPIMQGSSNFVEVSNYLTECDFELLKLNPIYTNAKTSSSSPFNQGYLNECDAFFTLKYNNANSLNLDQKMALFITYICFGSVNHAQALVDIDVELQKYLYHYLSPKDLSKFLILIKKYGLTGAE